MLLVRESILILEDQLLVDTDDRAELMDCCDLAVLILLLLLPLCDDLDDLDDLDDDRAVDFVVDRRVLAPCRLLACDFM